MIFSLCNAIKRSVFGFFSGRCNRRFYAIVAGCVVVSACGSAGTATPTLSRTARPRPTPISNQGSLAASVSRNEAMTAMPALAAREEKFKRVLASPVPVLTLENIGDAQAKLAQDLTLQNVEFLRNVRHLQTKQPLRNEIFTSRLTKPSDLNPADLAACQQKKCYRVEMYNYGYNMATFAIVDVDNRKVVSVNHHPNAQPDIPIHLTEIANQIAINAPEVALALGTKPGPGSSVMPNIKTALNGSACERSAHLCVAPTFIQGERALWAIVDLTDGVLIGTRWSDLGKSGPKQLITEQSLQNEVISEQFCDRSNVLNRQDWSMNYILTSSDGLMISNVKFQDKVVLRNAKLVDWHVGYSKTAGFGYSDAIGCPVFSAAAVVAHRKPEVKTIKEGDQIAGFALIQEFIGEGWPGPCNYKYEQRFEFYNDGRFRVMGGNHGRGCGTDGTYRPVLRIDINSNGTDKNSFAEWSVAGWRTWSVEQWKLQTPETKYSPEGYQYRISDASGKGYYIIPNIGQFNDGSRGDNSYVYVTVRHAARDEGDADLITIGPCCNTDHQQGPEKFIDNPPESIENTDLVLWYVAQMKNDNTPGKEYCWADTVVEQGFVVNKTWPCYFGPMFVPINSK